MEFLQCGQRLTREQASAILDICGLQSDGSLELSRLVDWANATPEADDELSYNSVLRLDAAFGRKAISLDDPDFVFDFCDVANLGFLCSDELKVALRVFGFAPAARALPWRTNRCSFRELVTSMQRTTDPSVRCQTVVPHALRGITLAQIQQVESTFVQCGWLAERCNEANLQRSAEDHERSENMHALCEFVVRPITSPAQSLAREHAKGVVPAASGECSYSELVNPGGCFVHYFVSHCWNHGFRKTVLALRRWACAQVHHIHVSDPADVVFWICLFAINQHGAAQDLSSHPTTAPFNAALSFSMYGGVMIVDEDAEPFERIWCVFEVNQLADLGLDLHLITEYGSLHDEHLNAVAGHILRRVGDKLANHSACDAKASVDTDKFKIWYCVADNHYRSWYSEAQFVEGCARGELRLQAADFKKFDVHVSKILASSLRRQQLQHVTPTTAASALQTVALGGCMVEEFKVIRANVADYQHHRLASRFSPGKWVNVLHCAAFFGNEDLVRFLLDDGADIDARSALGASALLWAANAGEAGAFGLLLDRRADPDARCSKGAPCLHWAALGGHAEIAGMLVRTMPHQLNFVDTVGFTPLHWAANQNHEQVVELLLQQGADVNMEGEAGTALQHARGLGHDRISELLVRAGAGRETEETEDWQASSLREWSEPLANTLGRRPPLRSDAAR
uniref:Uncharacterized protein n=1 Tax=Zooxanthella nutricula TaxID=1333877 RepID=A0A7S2Q9B8_9DINO